MKDISWGPGLQVTTMSKYVVNGYKFHIEDCSKIKMATTTGYGFKVVMATKLEILIIMVWSKKYYN